MAKNNSNVVTPRRLNGFSRPYTKAQIAAWVALVVSTVQFYAIVVPNVGTSSVILQVIVTILFTVSLLGVLHYGIITVSIDPIDVHLQKHLQTNDTYYKSTAVESLKVKRRQGLDVYMQKKYAHRSMLQQKQKEQPSLETMKHCWICDVSVQEPSMHCKFCNKCIHTFDHHCMWLNTCISARVNYVYFFRTMVFLFAYELLHLGSQCYVLWQTYQGGVRYVIATQVLLYIFIVFNIMSLLLIGQLITFHLKLQKKSMTTYEYIIQDHKSKRELARREGDLENQRVVRMEDLYRTKQSCRARRLACGGVCRNFGCPVCDPLSLPAKAPPPNPNAGFAGALGATAATSNDKQGEQHLQSSSSSNTTKNLVATEHTATTSPQNDQSPMNGGATTIATTATTSNISSHCDDDDDNDYNTTPTNTTEAAEIKNSTQSQKSVTVDATASDGDTGSGIAIEYVDAILAQSTPIAAATNYDSVTDASKETKDEVLLLPNDVSMESIEVPFVEQMTNSVTTPDYAESNNGLASSENFLQEANAIIDDDDDKAIETFTAAATSTEMNASSVSATASDIQNNSTMVSSNDDDDCGNIDTSPSAIEVAANISSVVEHGNSNGVADFLDTSVGISSGNIDASSNKGNNNDDIVDVVAMSQEQMTSSTVASDRNMSTDEYVDNVLIQTQKSQDTHNSIEIITAVNLAEEQIVDLLDTINNNDDSQRSMASRSVISQRSMRSVSGRSTRSVRSNANITSGSYRSTTRSVHTAASTSNHNRSSVISNSSSHRRKHGSDQSHVDLLSESTSDMEVVHVDGGQSGNDHAVLAATLMIATNSSGGSIQRTNSGSNNVHIMNDDIPLEIGGSIEVATLEQQQHQLETYNPDVDGPPQTAMVDDPYASSTDDADDLSYQDIMNITDIGTDDEDDGDDGDMKGDEEEKGEEFENEPLDDASYRSSRSNKSVRSVSSWISKNSAASGNSSSNTSTSSRRHRRKEKASFYERDTTAF